MLLMGLINRPVFSQEESVSGPRNIYERESNQKADTSTKVQTRTNAPERSSQNVAIENTKITRRVRRKEEATQTAALKYCVVMRGKDMPKNYSGVRNLTKMLPQDDGKFYGVADPDQNFREGDIVGLTFDVTRSGYLYILTQETNGNRKLIYPNDPTKTAFVKGDGPIMLGPFKIDPPAGTDKLTVVFSYQPIKAFENAKNLTEVFDAEVKARDYKTVEEEEIHTDTQQKLALYFAAQGKDGLKAEIDLKHLQQDGK